MSGNEGTAPLSDREKRIGENVTGKGADICATCGHSRRAHMIMGTPSKCWTEKCICRKFVPSLKTE